MIAAVVPSMAGVTAWWICAAGGLGLDITSIVVGLVVLLPGTPLAIWAGQAESNPGPLPAPKSDLHPMPAVIGEVPREPKAFEPRPELSARVEQVFSARQVAAVCALAGGRGVGKTHLAAAYARHCIEQGVPVAWLHAETVDQLHGSVDQMADELGLRGDADDAATVARKVRAWLQERQEPYLVVADNATDPDVLAPLIPSYGRARVLITTNDHSFERLGTLVTVEQFNEDEAVRYLSTRVGTRDGDGFRSLAEELDRLPLALAIAAATLVGPPRLPCGAYLVRLRSTPIEVLLARPRGEPYPRGVAQAIMLSAGEIGPAAAHLLGELSVLSTSGVGRDLLDPRTETALAELGARSLVTFSRDDTTAFVHRLIRRAVRDQAERDGTLAAMIESAARRLRVAVEDVADQDTWRKFPMIMAVADHATALWEAVEQTPDDEWAQVRAAAEVVLHVRLTVAHHLIYLNDQVRAVPIAEAVALGREKLLGAEHPDTLTALHTLAHASEDGSVQATALYHRAAAERARILGDDHPDTLWSRACAAFSYTKAGRASEAVTLLDEVLADQRRVLDPDHAALLGARFFQACTKVEAGRPEEGITLFRRLIADHERLFGADHPETWVIKGQLARAYQAAARTDEAVHTYERVAERQATVLGADHPDTLITRHGLAAAYEAAGRTAEALDEYEWVAGRFEAVMGPEQKLTKSARDDLERARRTLQQR
ncbi:tetratricopeptide repeat protein [Nonomuraea zeae]|uniref:Tetratricopeptide repeat protein n=1 Tax=Nonomuraea zeae TaxID=1642303 RepID=A0A5S4H307_9ACTN|nr:tetratricopeptide repeat protein [Nonomuraea zeae]TMR39638.1 tetratricopeptide repeat protein [Nonomuraea zeae]